MKTLKKICFAILMVMKVAAFSQEFIGSNIRFSKDAENCNFYSSVFCRYSAEGVGIIKLNDQNDEFSFNISLFPILTSPKENDSITSLNRNIYVNFLAKFPVTDLDFYKSNATESSFDLPGEVRINGITRPVNINVGIHASIANDIESRDAHSYPARISFVMDINPGDFNLDFETINFVPLISIEVRNGIINKSSGINAVR